MADYVEIFEVGPRDGLQNEKREIPVSEKVALVDCLSRAGFSRIEVASFVSPKWVPQMAGSAEVLEGITRVPGVSYAALTPNMRGFQDAMAAAANEVATKASTSWVNASRGCGRLLLTRDNSADSRSEERRSAVLRMSALPGKYR